MTEQNEDSRTQAEPQPITYAQRIAYECGLVAPYLIEGRIPGKGGKAGLSIGYFDATDSPIRATLEWQERRLTHNIVIFSSGRIVMQTSNRKYAHSIPTTTVAISDTYLDTVFRKLADARGELYLEKGIRFPDPLF